jgi:hypothetical protein
MLAIGGDMFRNPQGAKAIDIGPRNFGNGLRKKHGFPSGFSHEAREATDLI